MFFVEHQCCWFQKTQAEKHQFWVKRGVATESFFVEPVFCKCESYRFLFGLFWYILVDVQKHYKKVFQHILKKEKQPKNKTMTIFKGYLKGQVTVSSGAKFGAT